MFVLPNPALRLFLSVDIVGSTAYKLQRTNEGQSENFHQWFVVLSDFLLDFPLVFSECKSKRLDGGLPSDFTDDCTRLPDDLWKSLGDQLVFSAFIRRSRQIPWLVLAFRDAVLKYQDTLRGIDKGLDLKATAWLAGFPVNNLAFDSLHAKPRTSETEQAQETAQQDTTLPIDAKDLDFAGKDLDLGFRLCGYSTPRKMFVSVDLAYALSKIDFRDQDTFKFFYDGITTLKGIMHNRPYPLLSLHVQKRPEDRLESNALFDRPKILVFCKCYHSHHNDLLFPPFVYKDLDTESKDRLGEPPSNYDENLEQARTQIEKHNERAASGKSMPTPDGTEEAKASRETIEREISARLHALEDPDNTAP